MNVLNLQRQSNPAPNDRRQLVLQQVDQHAFVPPNQRSTEKSGDSALKRAWRTLLHRWLLILFVTLLGLLTSLLVTALIPTTYRATTQLQINLEEDATGSSLASHYELLKSRMLASQVIAEPGFTNPMEDPAPAASRTFPTWIDRLTTSIGLPTINTNASSQEERLLLGLTVEPVPDSNLVNLHYDHHDPRVAQKVVNTIATKFSNLNQMDAEANSALRSFTIDTQLAEAQKALDISEKKLADYAKAQKLVVTDGGDPVSQRLLKLEASVTAAEEARINAQTVYEQSRNAGREYFLAQPAVQKAQENYSKLQADYQEKLKFYKPDYPTMLDLQEKINIARAGVNEAIKATKNKIDADYSTAKQREATLRKQLEQQNSKFLDVSEKTLRYNTLKREVEANRSVYEGVLANLKQANSSNSFSTGQITIIDPALLPQSPIQPDLILNLVRGTTLGLLVGLFAAFLREHFDDRIRNRDTLENLLHLPVLGTIPHAKSMRLHLTAPFSTPPDITDKFRALRTNLMFAANMDTRPVIHVSSATQGEGKSSVCINMAISFAQAGKKVLLVDCDLRHPSLHKKFEIDNIEGLGQFLNGQIPLRPLIRTTQIPNVYMLPAGSPVLNPPELLLDAQMLELLNLTPAEYDMIILDSPPIMDLADSLILSHWASSTLLVVAHGQSREKQVLDAYHKLRHARASIVGSVLTKTKASSSYYYRQQRKYNNPAKGIQPFREKQEY